MEASILHPDRLLMSLFLPDALSTPYTILFFPGFDRTAREYVTLGGREFDANSLFVPFRASSIVIATEHVEGGWTNTDFATLMAVLMDQRTQNLVIVGDSYGGQVAARFFLWQYFHQLQPFQDVATILIGTPDGMDCVAEPLRTGAIQLAASPERLASYARVYAHDPQAMIDAEARAALNAQGRRNLIPVIADSYRAAAPLIPGNLRQMVAFPGFAGVLSAHVDAHAASGAPDFGPISFGGRVLTINATNDTVIDVGRTEEQTRRTFGRFHPITAESGPHGWLDIDAGAYALALLQAMDQLSIRGFGQLRNR